MNSLPANRAIDRFVESHQVHFVDRYGEMTDSQQICDERVPSRLRQHAVARIDQNDGEIGRGKRSVAHIARVLFMPRRIGDDELALRRREVAIGDIDGDALFTFGPQAIGEQRQIDMAAWRSFGHTGDLVFIGAL